MQMNHSKASLFFVVAVFVSLGPSVWAGGAGTSGAEFLKAGAGARAAGLGEASVSLSDDATVVYWNPAGLAFLPSKSVTLMHSSEEESTAYNFGAYAQKMGSRWGFGLGFQHRSVGDLAGRDTFGSESGSFTPTEMAVSLGFSRRFGAGSLGIVVKQVQSKIVDTASTVAGDIGVLWPKVATLPVDLGLTATNLGGKIRYNTETSDLPSAFRLGVGLHPSKQWLALVDVVSPKDNDAFVALGTEFLPSLGNKYSFALRLGYNTRLAKQVDGASGFSAGLGFGVGRMGLDYAFVPVGDLGSTHRISLSYSF